MTYLDVLILLTQQRMIGATDDMKMKKLVPSTRPSSPVLTFPSKAVLEDDASILTKNAPSGAFLA